jgi:mercuric ion transport protein
LGIVQILEIVTSALPWDEYPCCMDDSTASKNAAGKGLAAIGLAGGLGSILASSCCVIPLVLFGLGAGGFTFSTLEFLADYKAALYVLTGLILIGGWVAYLRQAPECEPACAPRRSRFTAAVLTISCLLLVTASSWNLFEPYLLKIIRAH